jgi:Arm DNA-binding domain
LVGIGDNTNAVDTNMPLTDIEVRTAKPSARLVKLSDGGGLHLWIMPDGAKRWRLARSPEIARHWGYPATGLREAREAREEAKRLLAGGKIHISF